ncbi:MAG: MBL fold metallo-hydrolase [Phycisphaerae bacterium]|nr:MBL fold metallo-hydrolase [Phycisphaerae bacterium]
MRIDLLDMGETDYGDCVLVRHDGRSILVDGAHPGDVAHIRSQLGNLLGHAPPFEVDLLVVTHCHNDHIGCLPALVTAGKLKAKAALVADERLGWGRDVEGRGPIDSPDLFPAQRALIAALQEEDFSDLPDDRLEEFLAEDVTLEEKYVDMLDRLADQGTEVVRLGRSADSDVRRIETSFDEFGLEVLGPTTEQLLLCARAIANGTDAIVAAIRRQDMAADADVAGMAEIYRSLRRRAADAPEIAADRWGVGAAKNGQSIVLKLAADGWSALLGGDIQLAKAEVPDLDPLIDALRQTIVGAGPYDFIKLNHHSSYNALDESVLDDWSATKLFAHSGGSNDQNHPEEGVLQLLKDRQDRLTFARTDRNGIVTVWKRNGVVEIKRPSKGRLNDFSVNPPRDERKLPAVVPETHKPAVVPGEAAAQRAGDSGAIEIIARIPPSTRGLTLTIKVESAEQGSPSSKPVVSPDVSPLQVAGSRPLPRLLFVTSRPGLEANLGKLEAGRVFDALAEIPSVRVVDLPPSVKTAEQAADVVRPTLREDHYAGVVLLGGYDVVPSHRLDVLDAAMRKAVEDAGQDGQDADDFIVWSDELYGDLDGDYIPELPVSRIPDGRRADVVFGALQAPRFKLGARFGVRNVNRPFAEKVFPGLPGNDGRLNVSEWFAPKDVSTEAAAGSVYFMLHGSSRDGARFWGETRQGSPYEAFAVENIPRTASGVVVFTGCCWGALMMTPPAAKVRPETPLRPRGPEASMAVAYLQAGALAFVGCTGSHYSPMQEPYDYFGKPMHDAFWTALANGKPPAEALFVAKSEFARLMPHGCTDPFSCAVEVKILRQYTCLGLGW